MQKINKKSISVKLSRIMVTIIVLQALLLVGSVRLSGVVSSLEDNAYSALNEKVDNRKNYLQNEMNSRFSNITSYAYNIIEVYNQMFAGGSWADDAGADRFLEAATPDLITALRATMTTGVFLVLDNNITQTSAHSAVYLRDDDPALNNDANRDINMLKGPPSVSQSFLIPLEKSWSYGITLRGSQEDTFNMPYEAAHKSNNIRLLGYWNVTEDVSNEGDRVITYSLPLTGKNGKVFGVMGVEISEDYLYKMLPYAELAPNKPFGYIIAKYNEQANTVTPVLSHGVRQNQAIELNKPLELTSIDNDKGSFYIKDPKQKNPMICCPKELKLYNSNTPFEKEKWVLVGIVDEQSVVGFAQRFTKTLSLVFITSIFLGIVVVLGETRRFVSPIIDLAKKVRGNDPHAIESMEKTGLYEIDELSNAIVELNKNVVEVSMKTDKIIGMVNLPLATFEYKKDTDYITGSPNLFEILGFSQYTLEGNTMSRDVFFEKMAEIMTREEDKENNIYMLRDNPAVWVKIALVDNANSVLGVVMDVTNDVLENHAIKFERDHDGLTKIYNRVAFKRETENIFFRGVKKVAAFVMFDLDNLKYINDVYGHDVGDQYIILAAQMLTRNMQKNAVVGRMSGDEFYVFLYDFESKNTVRELLKKTYASFENNMLVLPDGELFKLRMSGGIAWYGDETILHDELMRYADFAMYEGKNSVKGTVHEFDKEAYDNESFMLSGREELNKVLENKLADFVFQPIISTKTGEIYGYESLMRPRSKVLTSPLKLIQIAKAQSNLWQVERLTFFETMATYSKYSELFNGCKIFINSVPNERLREEEYDELEYRYPQIIKNVVVEIIENEKLDIPTLAFKRRLMEKWGGMIALDDYGTGYNGDISLLRIEPQIVKIDRLLIDDIENDRNRQSILQKLIKYGKEQGVMILAEGVETKAQMEKVVSMGIDLMQGYYIAYPMAVPNFDNSKIAAELKNVHNIIGGKVN